MRKKHSVMLIAVLAMILCLTMAFGITAFAEGEEPAGNPETPAETVVDQGCDTPASAPESAPAAAPESTQTDNAPQDNAPAQEAAPVQGGTPTQEAAPMQEAVPVQGETPVQEETPALEVIPTQEESHVQEVIPTQEESQVQEETPVQEDPQAEQTTPASDAPAEEAQQNEQEPGQVPEQEADVTETESPTQPTDVEPIQDPVEETAEEPAAKQDEENPAGKEPADADDTPELPGAPAPAEDPTVELPEGSSPELSGENSTACYAAQFYGLNDSVATLTGGEEAELAEFVKALGYEGEIESAVSSNPEAFDIADGKLRILKPFLEETLTIVINGQEVVINVHDPDFVNTDNIVAKFAEGGDFILESDTTVANGKLTIPSGKEVILDLNGFVLKGTGSGSVITIDGGSFTLKDSQPTAAHIDTSLPAGGVITGGNSDNGGGVYVGNGRLSMEGGNITSNAAGFGGGVYVMNGSFEMTGGSISGNTGCGSGVFLQSNTSFSMTGGAITDNTSNNATYGGGVVVFDNSVAAITLGGTAKITGNHQVIEGVITNNNLSIGHSLPVVSTTDAPNGMVIGVTVQEASDGLTIAGNGAAAKYFSSDDPAYTVVSSDGKAVLRIPGDFKAVIVDTDTFINGGLTLILNNIAQNGNTVRLLADVTENVTINADKDITLDLNGHVLKGTGSGSVITISNGASLTLMDINPTASHTGTTFPAGGVITGGDAGNGGGVKNNGSFTMAGGTITGNTAKANGGAVYINIGSLVMSGGIITGNTATTNGGGVANGGTFNMNGGCITGNTATSRGGGVYVEGEISSFTMSGGTITGNTAGNSGGGVYVTSGTFTLADGAISNNTADKTGGGVYIYNNSIYDSKFIMNGGSITENEAANFGGGVYAGSEFTMNDGTISGNKANAGSGVYAGGDFTMTGGAISGNIASYYSGVYVAGTVTVGGDAKITDNTAGADASNLYLPKGKTVTVNNLSSGANIGVTTETVPAAGSPVNITGENSNDYSSCFSSDNTEYTVINSADGSAQVVQLAVPGHTHDWKYGAGGATISASCGNTGCDVTENLSLTIQAKSATYDGKPHGAYFIENTLAGLTELPAIRYFMKDASGEYSISVSGVPTEAGEYIACFTVADATAKYMYKIAEKPLPPAPDPDPAPVVTEDAPKKAIVKTTDSGVTAVAEVKGTTAQIVVEGKNGETIAPVNVTILEPAELIAMGAKTAEIRMSETLTVVLDIEAAMCGKANCVITIDNIDGDITVACDGVKICEADFSDIAESIAKLVYDGKTLKAYDAQGNLIREYEIN